MFITELIFWGEVERYGSLSDFSFWLPLSFGPGLPSTAMGFCFGFSKFGGSIRWDSVELLSKANRRAFFLECRSSC